MNHVAAAVRGALALFILSCALHAAGQEIVSPKGVEEVEPNPETGLKAASDWVFMPIPISNPSIGTGLALTALHLFPFGGSSQPSLIGAGAAKTSNGTWIAGAGTQLRLDEDRWRVSFGAGVADVHYDFYGIGEDAGDLGASVPVATKTKAAFGSVLRRIGYGFYGGVGVRYAGTETSLDTDLPPGPTYALLSQELNIDTVGVSLIGQYDTRDHNFSPSAGAFAAVKFYRFDEALGSDLEYELLDGQWNQYFGIGRYGVIAGRVSVCDASDDAPFFDLCQFGQKKDLRGYVSGRYRDHAMYAAQVEYRTPFFHRFGAVVFAGFGQVAPDWGSFGGEMLTSAGAGLRYLASEKNKVTASVDYSRVKGEDAWYFYIGDAF